MIVLLDTSTPVCRLFFNEDDWQYANEWEAHRELAKGLLAYLQSQLTAQGKTLKDITGLVAYRGPGSFTGLRIGISVLNSLAYAAQVPIVGETGDDWRAKGIARLARGENDEIVLPEYGGEANIITPRK